jgi:hypothetical protein
MEHLKMPKTINNMVEEPEVRPPAKETTRPVQKPTDPVKAVERSIIRPPLTTFTNPSE